MAEDKTIFVKSTLPKRDGGEPIALFEQDERHPGGEVKISSTKRWTEVWPTYKIRELLTKGTLVEGTPDDVAQAQAAPEKAADDNLKLEIREDDTSDSLAKRYNRAQLLELAAQNEVTVLTVAKSNMNVAQQILDGVGRGA